MRVQHSYRCVAVISGVCVSASVDMCVRALKENRLKLSTPNLVDIRRMEVAGYAPTMRSNGQGHVLIKCAAGVGMHVDRTAGVFELFRMFKTLTSAEKTRFNVYANFHKSNVHAKRRRRRG